MKPLTPFLAAGLLVAVASSSPAQTSVNTSVGGSFASFTEGAASSTRRQDVAATAGFEHLFNGERGRAYYDFDGGTFDSPGDWTYYLNTAGFTYRFGSDDAAAKRLYLNGSFVVRKNGDAWAAADYSALGGGLNGEFHPKAHMTLRTGYRADYRSFSDMSALTQFEQRGFAIDRPAGVRRALHRLVGDAFFEHLFAEHGGLRRVHLHRYGRAVRPARFLPARHLP